MINGFQIILLFLKPIEDLILDGTISEVVVNGSDRVFIENCEFQVLDRPQMHFSHRG